MLFTLSRRIRLIVLSTLTLISLCSCEGIVGDRGNVHAQDSNEPLEKVMVILFLDKIPSDTTYTDSNGSFESTEFVGCVPDCPCASIGFIKSGFKNLLIDPNLYRKKNNQPTGDIKIVLERNY